MPIEITPPDLVPIQQAANEFALFVPRIGIALILILVFYFGHKIIQRVFARYSSLTRLPDEVTGLLRRTIGLAMFFFGATTALGTLGVDVTAIVAGLGLTGFALGFALQDIISNFLAGVLLTVQRPFRRGNYIRVGDKEGVVIDMDLRYTMLQRDNIRILIPNAVLFKEAIVITLRQPQAEAEPLTAPPPPVPLPPG